MDITFASESLRKELMVEKKTIRKHGPARTEKIRLRLFQLSTAKCLEELRNQPGPRLHQHTRSSGQEKAVFSVDLDHPYRLLFVTAHDPEPTLPGGGVDWKKVTAIRIESVEDTHG